MWFMNQLRWVFFWNDIGNRLVWIVMLIRLQCAKNDSEAWSGKTQPVGPQTFPTQHLSSIHTTEKHQTSIHLPELYPQKCSSIHQKTSSTNALIQISRISLHFFSSILNVGQSIHMCIYMYIYIYSFIRSFIYLSIFKNV